MEKLVNFEVDELEKIDFDNYSNEEFAIARMGFLSTKPNSHELKISEDVLRSCAKTVLDKWVVADMQFGEPTTHTKNEHIVGKIPKDQTVEFIYDENGYLRAYVDTVISKIYAKDFCEAFAVDTSRAVSVEMKVEVSESDENEVVSFNIVGVTVLGKTVLPSCPDSDINMIRFSQEDADAYFNKMNEHNLTPLKKFAKERTESMAKTYKIDKSKEAMSDKDWGSVDKTELRNKIMEASNKATLVKAVYMLVEDGWEEAPSEHLKYPVMMFEGDTLVYNRGGLSAALGYAKKEDETTVVNKIEKIYKKLDLDDNEGGKEEKMSEKVEFNETEQTMASEPEEVQEEKAEMSETSAEMAGDEKVECAESEKVEDDNFEETAELEEEPTKMSEDEMMAKIAELEKSVEERDHIIMDKDTELEELRAYKAAVVAKEMACRVDSVMEEVRTYINDEQFAEFKAEGLSCGENDIDAWSNKVKATCFSEVKKNIKKDDKGVFSFAMPCPTHKSSSNSIWDRLENK